jgi:hypothetical protein
MTNSEHAPVMNDFDLNVVDEALIHPEKPEYVDHFGFTVQVKTDNESDSSDSDDEQKQQDTLTMSSSSSSAHSSNKTASYFDMLLSKLTRTESPSTESPGSVNQKKLKEEAIQNLKLLKEEQEGNAIDWGKTT